MTIASTACAQGTPMPAPPAEGSAVGDLRLHALASSVFGNTRQLRVLVPADYDAPANRARRYPVLYLNDGQNLFDRATATFNPREWEVDETVRRLVAAGELPPMLVVGIDHAGRRGRAHEYLPWPDRFLEPPEPSPAGDRYPAFLVDEVVPFIEARDRARPEAAHRLLGGSSYGALAALYAAAVRPGVFGRLLLESPSFYVDDGRIFRQIDAAGALPDRVYLGVGTNEMGRSACSASDDGGDAVSDVRRMAALLRARGVRADRIQVAVEPCARHDEADWARRLPGALRFLFER